MTNTVLPS
uniref:Uncharacterized protein n=1 Tax=Anguilla anguilla TaxID=7936 RepID=A0A0E9QX43_ANGAN